MSYKIGDKFLFIENNWELGIFEIVDITTNYIILALNNKLSCTFENNTDGSVFILPKNNNTECLIAFNIDGFNEVPLTNSQLSGEEPIYGFNEDLFDE